MYIIAHHVRETEWQIHCYYTGWKTLSDAQKEADNLYEGLSLPDRKLNKFTVHKAIERNSQRNNDVSPITDPSEKIFLEEQQLEITPTRKRPKKPPA